MFIETLNRVTQGYTMHTPLKMIPSITLKEKVSPAGAVTFWRPTFWHLAKDCVIGIIVDVRYFQSFRADIEKISRSLKFSRFVQTAEP